MGKLLRSRRKGFYLSWLSQHVSESPLQLTDIFYSFLFIKDCVSEKYFRYNIINWTKIRPKPIYVNLRSAQVALHICGFHGCRFNTLWIRKEKRRRRKRGRKPITQNTSTTVCIFSIHVIFIPLSFFLMEYNITIFYIAFILH